MRTQWAGRWYRDREAWRFVARYVPWLAGLNLVWELVQLPLYTIWSDAPPGEIAFGVVHCTLGDVLIGAAAMLIALLALRAPALERWNWTRIGILAVLLGVAYTAFSEWMNTTIRPSWQYSNLMPVIHVGDAAIGLSPLAQWLILPPIGLCLAARGRRWQSV